MAAGGDAAPEPKGSKSAPIYPVKLEFSPCHSNRELSRCCSLESTADTTASFFQRRPASFMAAQPEFGGDRNFEGNVGVQEVGVVQSLQRALVKRLETKHVPMNRTTRTTRTTRSTRSTRSDGSTFTPRNTAGEASVLQLICGRVLTSHRSRQWLRKMKAMFSQPTACQLQQEVAEVGPHPSPIYNLIMFRRMPVKPRAYLEPEALQQ
ncbi:hypothetical protein EYF80_036322 [Liparis tanakae]|uniref:Uncharacterized protein n=1 Tax=Liparis tanakae TaxID=230148 RepID=A0A4Z2GJR6_9TELE|nr:hypothetical protein EYF80_036322 [Liparis tanakae]